MYRIITKYIRAFQLVSEYFLFRASTYWETKIIRQITITIITSFHY